MVKFRILTSVVLLLIVVFSLGYGGYQVWAQNSSCPGFNPDGKLGSLDVVYILANWGLECPQSPTPTPVAECGNQVCELNEYVPCPRGAQCIWAGSCPQDCEPWSACEPEAECSSGYECLEDPCLIDLGGKCKYHCQPKMKIGDYCEARGGKYLPDFNECEGLAQVVCEELGGSYQACASACRHDPNYPDVACIEVCVPVCALG